jgi:hypothetical protein
LVAFRPFWPDLAKISLPELPAGRNIPARTANRILVDWPRSGQNGQIPTVLADSSQYAEVPPFCAGFRQFGRNPANLDSDEIVRIPAFILDSGYYSQNSIKVGGILSISDRISSSVIFIG